MKRLVISLETYITTSNAPERDHPPNSEVIFSGNVDESEDPIIFADKPEEEGQDDDSRYIYAVWKLPVFLARPRMRFQSPLAVFTATASLEPAFDPLSGSLQGNGDYLQSGVPSGLNLLQGFGDDPAMNGVKPRLSALRVSRVAPVTQQARDLLRPIRSLPKLSFRIFPAVHSRMRFSRSGTAAAEEAFGSIPAIIAILEIDFTPFFECEILLDAIEVSPSSGGGGGGVVEDLTREAGLSLPLSCVAYDHVTFLYRVTPAGPGEEVDVMTISRHPTRELDISISATALERPGVCEPRLRMAWTATVDFTQPLNPGYGAALQPIQRPHRPSQISIGGDHHHHYHNINSAGGTTSLVAPAVARPDSLPPLEAAAARSMETELPELGITVTFSAPPATHRIYPGDVFAWTVLVVNRVPAAAVPASAGGGVSRAGATTPTMQPRKLALVAIPRRHRRGAADARIHRPPSVTSQAPFPPITSYGYGYDNKRTSHQLQQQQQQQTRDRSVADAVVDDHVVHAMQRSGGGGLDDAAPLASLSADVRVGPLAPGACHAAELRFLALRPGVHAVDAVRVVDLGSNEHVDVRELPTVVVESR